MKESEGVHSCGPTCKRPLCVANRRIRELEERLDVRDRHIDALKDERDIFKRTLDKRDAELYEVAKGKAEALQAWPSFERRIRELEASRIAYASEFDGDVGNIHQNIRELKAERDQWQESCGQLRAEIQIACDLYDGTSTWDGVVGIFDRLHKALEGE